MLSRIYDFARPELAHSLAREYRASVLDQLKLVGFEADEAEKNLLTEGLCANEASCSTASLNRAAGVRPSHGKPDSSATGA